MKLTRTPTEGTQDLPAGQFAVGLSGSHTTGN